MGKSKCRHVFILKRELPEPVYTLGHLRQQDVQPVPDGDQIRVVSNVAGRGAQVNDGLCQRTVMAKGVDMSHNIVPREHEANFFIETFRFLAATAYDISCP